MFIFPCVRIRGRLPNWNYINHFYNFMENNKSVLKNSHDSVFTQNTKTGINNIEMLTFFLI